jgi:hypothetical protein
MQPAQPAHRIGIASVPGTKLGIHLSQKPAARPDRESRDQANANSDNQSTSHSKGYRPDYTGDAHDQKMDIEQAAQQLGDRWDLKFHQQKGERRHREIKHQAKQDDSGG